MNLKKMELYNNKQKKGNKMKNTVTSSEFTASFHKMNRGDNFSHQGLLSLFEYIEQYESDCDTEIEFDPIAFCCEYSEYEDLAEFHGDYDKDDFPDLDALRDHTQVIEIPNSDSFIIQQF